MYLTPYLFVLYHTGLFNGYVTFVTSILMIGFVTAIIGDVAGHLGCFIFLKDSVNAIAFVALGTSVPGTYESSKNFLKKWTFYRSDHLQRSQKRI